MDTNFAKLFANEWIAAWNAHDLDRILSHYDDHFEMTSPIIVQLLGDPAGTLQGKAKVRAYWQKALSLMPDLKFELLSVLIGVNSITINYFGARGRLSAEIFYFGANHQVIKAVAHYAA
jgi:hypothetical protein